MSYKICRQDLQIYTLYNMLITVSYKGKSGILKGEEISLLARKNTIDLRRRTVMNNINGIRKKIEYLKKKEMELETKEALMLYRKFHKILGEEYSSELVVGLIAHAWENKSPKLKETWLQKATSFRPSQVAPQAN
ncbi:hypothetical protein IM40_08245 [Candidatus Paracaedimonas acanthamoebae]|nr:hypothetical protein IM40_08245 [Candidatus Paracaedimonas acanthamoebae]